MFHRVHPERDQLWDPMDVPLFEKAIKYISNKFDVVCFEETDVSTLAKHQRVATVMFDDGYLDNLEYAAPILQKYNIKASFYVATNCINQNKPTWTYELDYKLQHATCAALELPFEYIAEPLKSVQLADIDTVAKLKPALKKMSYEYRSKVLDSIHAQTADVELPKLMMNWQEVQQLKNAGHYIGSHSVNHYMLGTTDNQELVAYELQASAKTIQEELGHFPTTISYPIGSYNHTTIELSKEAGYTRGLATKQKRYHPDKDPIFEVPRVELYNESWPKTKMRIHGVVEQIKRILKPGS
ncbi:MAG: polysaccharide deacetylase family protein [Saprospiraceae bacterium]|nr:polysaccharide deacetylase family protein [Saprospiraceae bacterium]